MTYRTVRLGDYIEKIDSRNTDGVVATPMSVSVTKEFKPTGKKVDKDNLHSYKIVRPGQFAYVPTTGNEKRLCFALSQFNHDIVVTQVDIVFEVSSPHLLAEYLYIYLYRDEVDRYARFHSWGSAREVFGWEDMSEIEIPLPPIEKQREYVAIYSNLLKLSTNHEKSFADLQFITNTLTEKLVEKYGTEELGKYIAQTDTRNRDLAVKKVQGVSIQKKFIDSKANMDGVPLIGYKVVRPGEFAYVTVTSRNGQKISVALNTSGEPCIVSSTYITFTVANTDKLMAEFLLLWFKRPEFDRYARYNSWGSARETFDWSEMARVRIPVPPLAVQKSIVAIYHALESRKALNERLKNTIKDISPVLIKDAKDRCMEATG